VPGADGAPLYQMLSGTSMASPAVAGAAALLLQENHALPANTLKMALQFTARILPLADVLTQGAGALNIGGALALADAINPNVKPGRNWIRHRITAANRDAYGQQIAWGQRIIYGDRFVQPRYAQVRLVRWGDDLVWSYDAIADDIPWGGTDDNIVWGNDNIVWGNLDNIVWGNDDNIVWGNLADQLLDWGNDESDNMVWGIDEQIVWGHADDIAWGNSANDNIVWGNNHLREVWAAGVVWGFWDDNLPWGNVTRDSEDNIVWGNSADDDNIVWGNAIGGQR
jgi:hypothetical protein